MNHIHIAAEAHRALHVAGIVAAVVGAVAALGGAPAAIGHDKKT